MLCSRPVQVFTFDHPNLETLMDNKRYVKLKFELSPDTGSALVHGE